MFKKSQNKIINDYLQAIVQSLNNGGSTVHFWPFGPGQVDSYFIDVFSINIFEKFKNDRQKFKEALLTLNPKVLRWFLIPFVILGIKLARNFEGYQVEKDELVGFVQAVKEVLEQMVRSESFCLDRKNLLLDQEQVEEIVQRQAWWGPENKKVVSFLSVDLESYIWSIDFDLFAYGVFWHGPYITSTKKCLLIKEFVDLNSEIWNLNIPYSKIKIFYLFQNPIEVEIDFMNHIIYKDDIWNQLERVAVEVDGQIIKEITKVEELSLFFSEKREKQVKLVESLSPQELIRKGAVVNYYMFRQFFEYYQESWEVPAEVDHRIKEWGLKYWEEFKQQASSKQPSENFFVKLYSPENSYSG